jgi:hypothetical protein
VYRLLHGVLVIVVSRSHANVFANLNLVAAISRLLVAELKSVEITPERLLKKYAQVRGQVVGSSWVGAAVCVCVGGGGKRLSCKVSAHTATAPCPAGMLLVTASWCG